MTNLERIRTMTAEEMAVTIMCPNEMGLAEIDCNLAVDKNCRKCCLAWLQAEETAQEEGGGEMEKPVIKDTGLLSEICSPVVNYLKENHNPYITIHITSDRIVVTTDECSIPFQESGN